MFSKKATKIDEIFAVALTICSNFQINGEDFVDFCGLLRKRKLYEFNTKEINSLFARVFYVCFCPSFCWTII